MSSVKVLYKIIYSSCFSCRMNVVFVNYCVLCYKSRQSLMYKKDETIATPEFRLCGRERRNV